MFRLALAAAALAGTVFSAPAQAQSLLETCEADIAANCAAVEPGDGRIAACLYAHTATLSEPCYAATADLSRLLEEFFDGLISLVEVCGADMKTHCSGPEVEAGRKLQCLASHKAELTPECAGMLTAHAAYLTD